MEVAAGWGSPSGLSLEEAILPNYSSLLERISYARRVRTQLQEHRKQDKIYIGAQPAQPYQPSQEKKRTKGLNQEDSSH